MSYGEIKKSLNSTVGTEEFKPLNQLFNQMLDQTMKFYLGGREIFLEDGTFQIPYNAKQLKISAIAAGGNGTSPNSDYLGGNGGNAGELIENYIYNINKETSVDITVGTGNTVLQFKGMDSGVINTITLIKGENTTRLGGVGGTGSSSSRRTGGGGGGAGGLFIDGVVSGYTGMADGTGGNGAGYNQGGGMGGSMSVSSNGRSQNGGDATYPSIGGAKGGQGGKNDSSNTGKYSSGGGGAGAGYGAGGGGGGNRGSGGAGGSAVGVGGQGANGVVVIEW